MSLLKAQGHPEAHKYPLGMLLREGDTARKRINRHTKTMLQGMLTIGQATSGVQMKQSTRSKAFKNATDFLEKLDDGD